MVFDNLYAYNYYGAGDVFLSKQFIKDIMTIVPANNYYYSHGKNKRILADMPELKFTPITDNHIMRNQARIVGNDLYIGTWVGITGEYCKPANSVSIENCYRMYNDILTHFNLGQLTYELDWYIPSVDKSYFQIKGVDDFIEAMNYHVDKNRLVLFCNCLVQSNQAENFDFDPILEKVAAKYKDIIFLVTNDTTIRSNNIILTKDITNTDDGFDLNEVSYLSRFCDTLIGRSSGAQVFSMTRENCMDPSKAFLSFTYRPEAAHFCNKVPGIKAKVYWSNATKEDVVCNIICRVLER